MSDELMRVATLVEEVLGVNSYDADRAVTKLARQVVRLEGDLDAERRRIAELEAELAEVKQQVRDYDAQLQAAAEAANERAKARIVLQSHFAAERNLREKAEAMLATLRESGGLVLLSFQDWPSYSSVYADSERRSALYSLAAAIEATPVAHVHQWVDARNAVVEQGQICVECGALRSGNDESTGTTT
jgi:vacuolar-type H+-ATPase subunit I/STV1